MARCLSHSVLYCWVIVGVSLDRNAQTCLLHNQVRCCSTINPWCCQDGTGTGRPVFQQHDGKWDEEVQRGYTDGDDDESVLPEARDTGESLGLFCGENMLDQVSVFFTLSATLLLFENLCFFHFCHSFWMHKMLQSPHSMNEMINA